MLGTWLQQRLQGSRLRDEHMQRLQRHARSSQQHIQPRGDCLRRALRYEQRRQSSAQCLLGFGAQRGGQATSLEQRVQHLVGGLIRQGRGKWPAYAAFFRREQKHLWSQRGRLHLLAQRLSLAGSRGHPTRKQTLHLVSVGCIQVRQQTLQLRG